MFVLYDPVCSLPGDSWYFRLVSCLWNENQFVNHVNLLYQNELVHVHCMD